MKPTLSNLIFWASQIDEAICEMEANKDDPRTRHTVIVDALEKTSLSKEAEAAQAALVVAQEALADAVKDTNAAHEAIGAFMKLEGEIEVAARMGRPTERVELTISFQKGALRHMFAASEREAFIGCGIAITKQVRHVCNFAAEMHGANVVQKVIDERATLHHVTRTFDRNPTGGWFYRLAQKLLFKLMPENSEVVLRKLTQ